MLNVFDWIRRSRNGAELLATMKYFRERKPDTFPENKVIASPITYLTTPCNRCWIYPCNSDKDKRYCKTCYEIIYGSKTAGIKSKNAIVVWGHVNQLPKNLEYRKGFYESNIYESYVHDDNHFMLIFSRYKIRPWLQELLLYHGSELKGLLQLFPTSSYSTRGNMNDIINRAVHHDSRFPMDLLRIRFFSNPFQIFSPRNRDDAGILTFEIMEFIELLQRAYIFRSLLRPDDQQLLKELLNMEQNTDGLFQLARFAGSLSSEAREMLNSWSIRLWSKDRVDLLYELIEYVEYA